MYDYIYIDILKKIKYYLHYKTFFFSFEEKKSKFMSKCNFNLKIPLSRFYLKYTFFNYRIFMSKPLLNLRFDIDDLVLEELS